MLESSTNITGEHRKHWRKERTGARKFDIVLLLQLKHILESFNYCCENSNGNVPSYFNTFLTFSVGIEWDIGVKKVKAFHYTGLFLYPPKIPENQKSHPKFCK